MQQEQPRRVSRLAGIIIFGVFVIVLAMFILVSFTVLGSVFSAFDKMTNLLPSSPVNWLGLYNSLRSTTANVFPLLATMMIIASVGALIAAIFKLNQPGSDF